MFTFHLQGLSIAAHGDNGLTVLMLNSAFPRKQPNVPYHLPTLVVTRNSVVSNSVPRLPSLLGRWATPKVEPEGLVGWSLSGTRLHLGQAPVEAERASDLGAYPQKIGTRRDWSDMHWVLNARKMLPTGRLRHSFRMMGYNTASIAHFAGGRIKGGSPFGVGGAQYSWQVRPGYEQGLTDTLDVVYDSAPPALLAYDCDWRHFGTIEFADEGEAWLINEAPSRAINQMEGESEECEDSKILLDAFETDTPEEKLAVVFKRGEKLGDSVPSGTSCNLVYVDERSGE